MAKKIAFEDIIDMGLYARERAERRRAVTEMKKNRRLAVGPDATFYFENYATMFHQVHEMLHIEGGGRAQIEDELRAYNPLIPDGGELVATLMFEIDDPDRRARVLAGLGGVEHTVSLTVGGHVIEAIAEEDIERTSETGKASSIQFLHFPFTAAAIAAFKAPGAEAVLAIGHDAYGHMAKMPEAVRAALAEDFD